MTARAETIAMRRYWFEKRVTQGLSFLVWPVRFEGWIFQPFVVWALIMSAGLWLAGFGPERWQNGLVAVVVGLALVLTCAFIFRMTDPGPGWNAGWEKEKTFTPRYGLLSGVSMWAGLIGAVLLIAYGFNPLFVFGGAYYCHLIALRLFYESADPNCIRKREGKGTNA